MTTNYHRRFDVSSESAPTQHVSGVALWSSGQAAAWAVFSTLSLCTDSDSNGNRAQTEDNNTQNLIDDIQRYTRPAAPAPAAPTPPAPPTATGLPRGSAVSPRGRRCTGTGEAPPAGLPAPTTPAAGATTGGGATTGPPPKVPAGGAAATAAAAAAAAICRMRSRAASSRMRVNRAALSAAALAFAGSASLSSASSRRRACSGCGVWWQQCVADGVTAARQ